MGGQPTLVYPGAGTKCINGDEYAFAVVPGDKSKVLYYFQGGGACWEADGAYGKQVVMQCTDSMDYGIVTSGYGYGIQNSSNADNPFKDYTVIEPIYCSGDAHMGMTTMELDGTIYPQVGYKNAKAVMDWAKTNLGKTTLESFVISGFSAGSLGTMAWAETLLGTFSYTNAVVLMDSYMGYFPPDTNGATIARWGTCKNDIVPKSLTAQCQAKMMPIQRLLQSAMSKYPDVPFAFIQSKFDSAQTYFYKGMAQSWGMVQYMGLTDPQFYQGTNQILERFDNAVVYYVDSDQHCFTQASEFFTASTVGKDAPAPDGKPSMVEWVAALVTEENATVACDGEVEANGADSTTYCDKSLMGREVYR
jgi:hypothetical protein